jgi:hypothetical protein
MNVSDSEPEKVDSNDEWEEQDPGDLLGPISSSEEKNEEVEVNNNDMINHETVKLKPSRSPVRGLVLAWVLHSLDLLDRSYVVVHLHRSPWSRFGANTFCR